VLVLQRAEESLDDAGSQGRNCWRGVCERGNYIREMPGRRIRLIDCGYHTGLRKIIITTPTGHHHLSRAPDPP